MPRVARPVPEVRGTRVELDSGASPAIIHVGSAAWFSWLDSVSSFAFVGKAGRFTARKERRARGGWYWKAYRTVDGAPVRAYLGKSGDLTAARLEDTARRLAQRDAPPQARSGEIIQRMAARADVSGSLPRPAGDVPVGRARSTRRAMPTRSWTEPPVATKLGPAPLRSHLVRRARLTAALDTMAAGRLTVISAPPGCGKTTLLSQWIGQTDWRVAYVALDAADSDPARFCRYLCEALNRVCPGVGTEPLRLLHAAQFPAMSPILTLLINALAEASSDIALVIDDYHHIVDDSIHEALSFLIERGPDSLHVVLSTRTDPPLPLARLRVRHQLHELRADDLAFQVGEARSFLRDTMGLHVSEEDVSALASCTEGWVGGLQLAALSLQGRSDVPATVRALTSGGHRALADYLMDEVIRLQPNDVREFLLSTCVLDRFSAPLCAAVTDLDTAHVQTTLDRLEHDNLFLVPLDTERRWYRYHHLFAEFLRERLQRTQPEVAAQLHARASHWYERSGASAEAISHALAAGEFARAGGLIQVVGPALVHTSEISTVLRWLQALPSDTVRASHKLCLLNAWAEATRGQFEAADAWLRVVETRLEGAAEVTAVRQVDDVTREADAALVGEAAALRAHVAAFWGDNPATITYALQALEHLPDEALFLRALTAFNLGIAHWLECEVLAASEALSRAYACAEQADNPYIALLALCARAQVEVVMGERRAALQTAKHACNLASKEGRSLPAAAYAYAGMGLILYEFNHLDTAAHYLLEGIRHSLDWNTTDMLVYGYTVLAQVRQAQGDEQAATDMIRKAEQGVRGYQQRPWIVAIMAGQQVRLAIAQGRIDDAMNASNENQNAYVGVFDRVTLVRLHLARSEADQALRLIEELLPAAEAQGRGGSVTELKMLRALAHAQLGAQDSAMADLAVALARAEPEGYVRLFADEGEPMAVLLAEYIERARLSPVRGGKTNSRAYARSLLAAIGHADARVAARPALARGGIASSGSSALTGRELEILRGLLAGRSNVEIARHLTLEVSTVKWHLSRIYAKLNVQRRTQAIRKARELTFG